MEPLPHALYRTVWRWHFFAGLLVAPVLIVLAVTGSLYLFKNELEGWWYRDLVRVADVSPPLAASVQEQAVLRAYPGAELLRYTAPVAPRRASEWWIRTRGGEALTVFVDPARAAVRGAIGTETRLMAVVFKLHGQLMLGRSGDTVVELAASWAFLLLASGLFLWWPRRWRAGGVVFPRLRAKGRLFWRDLHVVPAAWNASLVAFLIVSGLPWSGFFGQRLARYGALTAATAPSPNFAVAPVLPGATPTGVAHPASHADAAERRDLPWVIRNSAEPLAEARAAQVSIDRVMEEARALELDRPGLSVIYPEGNTGVFTLSLVPDQAQDQRTVYLHPDTGERLGNIGWREYSPLGKAVEFGVATHVGRQFGLANRLVLLMGCLVLICTVVSGYAMWWIRRPRGELGAPPVPTDPVQRLGVIGVACGLGLCFPLAGLSMLGMLLASALLPRVRRAA